jgi:hypothetical protein
VKNKSYKLCERRSHHKYASVQVPTSSTIFELVNKLHSTGFYLEKKYIMQNIVLIEEKPEDTGDRLGHFPHESQT